MISMIFRVSIVASSGSDTAVKADQRKCTPIHHALTHPSNYQVYTTMQAPKHFKYYITSIFNINNLYTIIYISLDIAIGYIVP